MSVERRGYGLTDEQLARLLRAELFLVPEAEPGEEATSWLADWDGHLLRVVAGGERGFEVVIDGEPLGEVEPLPPGWRMAGFA